MAVIGTEEIRERVRNRLVESGVACVGAAEPSALEPGALAHIVGRIMVGVDTAATMPEEWRAASWCLTLSLERSAASALIFVWPDEALALICTVLALRHPPYVRPASDVVIEQRIWALAQRTRAQQQRFCVEVEDGAVTLSVRRGSSRESAHLSALARAIPGVRSVGVVEW